MALTAGSIALTVLPSLVSGGFGLLKDFMASK